MSSPRHKLEIPLTPPEAALFEQIQVESLPKHIAIIMDGNGRWAQQRNMSRIKGHKAAISAVQQTVEACIDLGIQCLTLYAFSTENWKRPIEETGTLMALLRQYLRIEGRMVEKHRLRVRAIGDIEALAPGIQRDLQAISARTTHYDGMCFNLALNYSGRTDILNATRRLLAEGLDPAKLNESLFSSYLGTAGQPDPDLVIRSSGEMRVSNFLLWQIAYAEIFVTPTLWPDFTRGNLYEAVLNFQSRQRRFGGI